MTRTEVLDKFKVLIDKSAGVAFGGYPAFIDSEIEIFLNQAMREVISNKYNEFEASDKRIADLQSLIGTALIAQSNSTEISNAVSFDLPNDFWFYVDSYVGINNSVVYQVELTTHDIAKKFAVTHDNDPYIPVAKAVIEDNKLIVYYDTHIVNTINNLSLAYIYTPVLFVEDNIDSGLNDKLLDEIINRAVLIALENIESQRVQTKAQLNSIQE